MPNSIITGGYGGSSNAYADIDWTKAKHEITFNIAPSSNISFSILATDVTFDIQTFNKNFSINSFNETFNMITHHINFTVDMFR